MDSRNDSPASAGWTVATTFTHDHESHPLSNEMAGGESTASNESPPATAVSEHVKEVLELKFPRCSACSLEWYSYDADDEEGDADRNTTCAVNNSDGIANGDLKPSSTASSLEPKARPRRVRPSHTKLLPLPQCLCASRMIVPLDKSYENSTEQSPQKILDSVRINKFPNLAICKHCLQKKIAVSNEVQIYDYRQDNVENGQRSIKYSLKPQCDQCKQTFIKRTGYNTEKLENEGKKSIVIPGNKKEGLKRKEFNWFDSVEAQIKLVWWMKRQKRRGMCKERRFKHNMQSGDGKQHAKDWWVQYGCSEFDDGYGSSDACYSFSSDSDSDLEPRKPKGPPRQMARDGELGQEYRQKMEEAYQKLRRENAEREKEDHEKAMELAKKLEAEAGPKTSDSLDQLQKDIEMAKKLEAELKSEDSDHKKKMEVADRKIAEELSAKLKNQASEVRSTQKKAKTPSPRDKKRKADSDVGSSLKQTKLKTKDPSIASPDTAKVSAVDSGLLSELIGMGFEKDAAEHCLRDAGGDVNLAATMLLSEER